MLWITLALIAAFLWAAVNILDKHVVSDELKDPILCAVVPGIVSFILAWLIPIFFKISLPFNVAILAIIAGAFTNLAVLFYYKALKHGDVSRVIPLFLTCPLFVLLIATIFLGEHFGLTKYLGIFLLVSGAIIISLKKGALKNKLRVSTVIFVVLFSALLYASRDVLIRYLTFKSSIWPILFWMALGSFLTAVILFAMHHPHILKKRREMQGIEHLFFISIMSTGAFIAFATAISLAEVALVSALVNTKVFLVLALAILLSRKKPEIIREHLESSTIFLKIVGTIMLFAGSILIIA